MDTEATTTAGGHGGRPMGKQVAPLSSWEAFGRAVLGFHVRVGRTAMCQCGVAMRACDIWAQAAQHGIRPGPD